MINNRKVIGLYNRVSTGIEEQNGLEKQKKECTRIAIELFGKEIDIRCYADEGPGTKSNIELDRMVVDAKHGELDAIITYKVSRISRTISHALKVVKELHNANVRFIGIIEGEYNPHYLSLEYGILETATHYERENHAERSQQGIGLKKQLKKEGVHNEN